MSEQSILSKKLFLSERTLIWFFTTGILSYYFFNLIWYCGTTDFCTSTPTISNNWYEFYFVFLIFNLFLAGISGFFNDLSNKKVGATKELYAFTFGNIAYAVFVGVGIYFVRSLLIDYMPMWEDENTHINYVLNDAGVVRSCSLEAQPPLGCLLSWVASQRWGLGVEAFRFNIILASTMSSVLIFFLVIKYLKNYIFAAFVVVVFSFVGLIVQYSYELRPIIYGVMHFLLYCMWFFYLMENDESNSLDFAGFVVAGVLLILSLGMQPLFFLGILSGCLAVCGVIFKRKKMHILFGLNILVLLLCFPILNFVRDSHARVFTEGSNVSLRIFIDSFSELTWPYAFHQLGFLIFYFVAIFVTCLLFFLKSKEDIIRENRRLFEIFFTTSLAFYFFYFFFPAVFTTFVAEGYLQPRYTAIGWPLLLIVITLGLAFIINSTSSRKKVKILYELAFLLILLYGVSLNFKSKSHPQLSTTFGEVFFRRDLQPLYSFFKLNLNDKYYVFRGILCTKEEFCATDTSHILSSIYMHDNINGVKLSPAHQPYEMFKIAKSEIKIEKLIVYFDEWLGRVPKITEADVLGLTGISMVHISHMPVIIFESSPEVIVKQWYEIMSRVGKNFQNIPNVNEYLIQKALLANSEEDFIKYWGLWKLSYGDLWIDYTKSRENSCSAYIALAGNQFKKDFSHLKGQYP